MTDLSRKNLLARVEEIPPSAEGIETLKSEISAGLYDVQSEQSRDLYLDTLSRRWRLLSKWQRRRLHALDSLLYISVAHLAGDEEPDESLRSSAWTWPLVALIALLGLVLSGTTISLFLNP